MNKIIRKLQSIICPNKEYLTRRVTNPTALKNLLKQLYPIKTNLIRIGPQANGGYLLTDEITNITSCFSPGVGQVCDFELDIANRGIKVFFADGTVKKLPKDHNQFNFIAKNLGSINNKNTMTLESWVNDSVDKSENDLLLQIDIEGAEYETIIACPESVIQRFKIIVGEFHNLDQLWNRPYFEIISAAFQKILKTHICIHNHPNNYRRPTTYNNITIPTITEISFLRRDAISGPFKFANIFPHPLDSDTTNSESLVLPKDWYYNQ